MPDWYPRYRGFKDTVRLDAGLESRADSRVRFGGRIRLETGAVDQSGLSPLQVAGPSATFAGALQLRLVQHLVLTANYELAWYPTGTSESSAFDPLSRLACVDSGYSFDACEAARAGRALPTAAGSYHRFRHALAVSIRYDSL